MNKRKTVNEEACSIHGEASRFLRLKNCSYFELSAACGNHIGAPIFSQILLWRAQWKWLIQTDNTGYLFYLSFSFYFSVLLARFNPSLQIFPLAHLCQCNCIYFVVCKHPLFFIIVKVIRNFSYSTLLIY